MLSSSGTPVLGMISFQNVLLNVRVVKLVLVPSRTSLSWWPVCLNLLLVGEDVHLSWERNVAVSQDSLQFSGRCSPER